MKTIGLLLSALCAATAFGDEVAAFGPTRLNTDRGRYRQLAESFKNASRTADLADFPSWADDVNREGMRECTLIRKNGTEGRTKVWSRGAQLILGYAFEPAKKVNEDMEYFPNPYSDSREIGYSLAYQSLKLFERQPLDRAMALGRWYATENKVFWDWVAARDRTIEKLGKITTAVKTSNTLQMRGLGGFYSDSPETTAISYRKSGSTVYLKLSAGKSTIGYGECD